MRWPWSKPKPEPEPEPELVIKQYGTCEHSVDRSEIVLCRVCDYQKILYWPHQIDYLGGI